jgi:hypothetical protein
MRPPVIQTVAFDIGVNAFARDGMSESPQHRIDDVGLYLSRQTFFARIAALSP